MGIGWLIGLASLSILFFFAYLFFSSNNYKRRFKDKYDLRNHFPYEFNYESKFFDNPLGNVSLIMSMLFSIAFYSLTAVYNIWNYLFNIDYCIELCANKISQNVLNYFYILICCEFYLPCINCFSKLGSLSRK